MRHKEVVENDAVYDALTQGLIVDKFLLISKNEKGQIGLIKKNLTIDEILGLLAEVGIYTRLKLLRELEKDADGN